MIENKPLFGKGNLNVDYAQYFIGNSYLKFLTSQADVAVNSVTFEPGARNDWHVHNDGFQILLVTDGEGWYQEAGKAPQELKKGAVVSIASGVKHWHGATRDSWFTHVAIGRGTTTWLESVNDAFYNEL
ncbi:MAG: cupin domain-containing protein [Streptococcaceae bacterium]|nr:cupin domain-containing protein [Streptococcaceae bacterium]MCH4176119.1 cupin domain-containing protein [Streptococcaceae bacterium]